MTPAKYRALEDKASNLFWAIAAEMDVHDDVMQTEEWRMLHDWHKLTHVIINQIRRARQDREKMDEPIGLVPALPGPLESEGLYQGLPSWEQAHMQDPF